jgi:NAD(P)-dependent dehydrogenase (short-subunit alcohol dehydrogenase family)
MPDMSDKAVVVTGANTGIGFATAKAFAAKRAKVFIGCRSQERGIVAANAIRKQHPDADVSAMPLNLASLASVRGFSTQLASRCAALDVLVNNAGVMMTPFGATEDGFELQFGTNVLGHFVLTGLLLPLMEKAGHARVVTLSSLGHWNGQLDFDNLNGEKGYNSLNAYEQSKLAGLVFAYELQRRLMRARASTSSLGAHPGVTNSGLGRHAWWVAVVLHLYGQSTDQGALPALRAATDPQVKGGEYVGPGGFRTYKGAPTVQPSSDRSLDPLLGQRLWQVAQDLTAVRYL